MAACASAPTQSRVEAATTRLSKGSGGWRAGQENGEASSSANIWLLAPRAGAQGRPDSRVMRAGRRPQQMERDARRAEIAMRVVRARSCLLDVDWSNATVYALGQRSGRDDEQLRERHESRDRTQPVTEAPAKQWSRTAHHESTIVGQVPICHPAGAVGEPGPMRRATVSDC